MITKTNSTLVNLKNLFIEIFLDKTNKISNIADGSVVNATAFGVSKIAQKAIKDIAIKEAQIFPESATGEYLDKAAALYGVSPRKGALGSSTYVRVYANPGTTYNNTMYFINTNGIRFSVDETLTVNETGYGYVKVRSVNAGYSTNVSPNSIVNVAPIPNGHIECTNEYYAVGGRDSEDDETFRVRIKNNLNILSKGTIEYFTQIFQNLDDRILKVMNVGLNESGYFVLYIVTQNGIFLSNEELENLLNNSQKYFGLSELNLNGTISGIVLRNAEWFYVGSERGMDFRLDIDSDYNIATVRKNIQVALTKYLDFRFWIPGKIVQWDDLLDIVKKSEGVKYVPDQYFFPYYDEQVPANQLPRIRGLVMRDANGNVLYDDNSTLSPAFYPQDSEDIFKGLSDKSIYISQQVYFTITDKSGNPIEGVRISVGKNIIITDSNGQAILSLQNGSYNYILSKNSYETTTGSFVVLNSSITISDSMDLAPWIVTFIIKDENELPISGAEIIIEGKQLLTNINGLTTIALKNGTYNYIVNKIGFEQIEGRSFTINNSDKAIEERMYYYAWNTTLIVLDQINNPIPGTIVEINNGSYLTNSEGKFSLSLINGTYNVILKKIGYNELKKSLVILNQESTTTYTMTQFEYSGIIKVVQENSLIPVVGALVSVLNTNISGITNENGMFNFKLVNGVYNLNIVKREFDDILSSFNVNNSNVNLNFTMTFRHFEVVITAIDEEGNFINGALVNINNEVHITDSNGQAILSLQNGSYPFTITKIGYNEYQGNVNVLNTNNSIIANMTFYFWRILFTVYGKQGALLENAIISIYGSTYQTNENGQVDLYLKNGSYPYSISYQGYENYEEILSVTNKDINIDINMQEKRFSAVFSVVGLEGISLSDVIIQVGEQQVTTNEGGIATLLLVNGSYDYIATRSGYVQSSGSFIINNSDSSVFVNMVPISYDIVFKLTDNNTITPNLLSGVEISIDNKQIISTNEQGEAFVRLYGGTHTIFYSLSGYIETSNSIEVSGNTTFLQVLKKIWNMSFNVTSATDQNLIGAKVKVNGEALFNGETTLITKEDGTTDPIDVVNGSYTYSVLLDGYSSEEGTGNIIDNNKIQSVQLTYGFQTTFIVKSNILPIQGVSITIDGITEIVTNSEGIAKLNLSNGRHTYVFSKTGFMSGSGTIDINNEEQSIPINLIAGGRVTFLVNFQDGPLANVKIAINNSTNSFSQNITTDAKGIAIIELQNDQYNYTTSIIGYKDKESTSFAVNSSSSNIFIDLTDYKYYTITTNTKVGVSALNGVVVKLFTSDDIEITTGTTVNGSYIFTNVVNGSYKVSATLSKYWTLNSKVNVQILNSNITTEFVFQQVSNITFTLKDTNTNNPIANTKVNLVDSTDSSKKYSGTTNSQGIATIVADNILTQPSSGVLYGSYNYTVESIPPYITVTGSIVVNSENINKDISLISDYNVTFNITKNNPSGGTLPLQDAIIIPDGDDEKRRRTNAQGQAVISLRAQQNHTYTISASDYLSIDGSTGILTGNLTVDKTLVSVMNFTIIVRADTNSGAYIPNVAITVKSKTGALYPINITKTSDSVGQAIFLLPVGEYDVTPKNTTNPKFEFSPLTINVVEASSGSGENMQTIIGTGFYVLKVNLKRNGAVAKDKFVNLYLNDTLINVLKSDKNGQVIFSDVKAVNNYSITVMVDGNTLEYNQSNIVINGDLTLDVSLTAIYVVEINALISSGDSIGSGAQFEFTYPDGFKETNETTSSGTITYTDVTEGNFSIKISKLGFTTFSIIETITPSTEFLLTYNYTIIQIPKLVQISSNQSSYILDGSYKYVSILVVGKGGYSGIGTDTPKGTGRYGGGSGMVVYKANKEISSITDKNCSIAGSADFIHLNWNEVNGDVCQIRVGSGKGKRGGYQYDYFINDVNDVSQFTGYGSNGGGGSGYISSSTLGGWGGKGGGSSGGYSNTTNVSNHAPGGDGTFGFAGGSGRGYNDVEFYDVEVGGQGLTKGVIIPLTSIFGGDGRGGWASSYSSLPSNENGSGAGGYGQGANWNADANTLVGFGAGGGGLAKTQGSWIIVFYFHDSPL